MVWFDNGTDRFTVDRSGSSDILSIPEIDPGTLTPLFGKVFIDARILFLKEGRYNRLDQRGPTQP
jgi:hypothetical protein